MRKETKYILRAGLIVAGAVAAVDLFLQYKEVIQKGLPWNWKNFDGKRLFNRSVLGFGLGSLGGQGLYLLDSINGSEKEFKPEIYLRKTLSNQSVKKDSKNFEKAVTLRQPVKDWLNAEFAGVLVAPVENAGSLANHTAIRGNYDIDILIPFAKKSYSSLAEMIDDLFESTVKKYSNVASIDKHKKGVILKFYCEQNDIKFDLIPGREIGKYSRDKALNLYKAADNFWETDSSMKIIVPLQNKNLVNKPHTRNIIKLLKFYRDRNDLPLASVFIEQCVFLALSSPKSDYQNSLTEDLQFCMLFLASKLDQKAVKDISNSNNNLNSKISEMDRSIVALQLSTDVARINQNPHYLREIFDVENV